MGLRQHKIRFQHNTILLIAIIVLVFVSVCVQIFMYLYQGRNNIAPESDPYHVIKTVMEMPRSVVLKKTSDDGIWRYKAEFKHNNDNWWSYNELSYEKDIQMEEPGYISIHGPFKYDDNHSYVVWPVVWTQVNQNYEGTNLSHPDFRNAEISIKLRGRNIKEKGAAFYFAVVAYSSIEQKYVYLAYKEDLLKYLKSGQWEDVVVTLDPNKWLCLGASEHRTGMYGCADMQELLKDINENMQFIWYGFEADAPPEGIIDLASFQIDFSRPYKK